MIDYDGGHPLVWIGVGSLVVSIGLPTIHAAHLGAVVGAAIAVVGIAMFARGLWIAIDSRGGTNNR